MTKGRFIPNIFDEYTFKARYIPAIIVAVPFMMLSSLVDARNFDDLFKYLEQFLIVGKISMNAILMIFFTFLVRAMGKYIVEHFLFCDGLKFPTTEMLLWKTKLISNEKKTMLHIKIKEDFINLATREEEDEDEQDARLRVKDAVMLICSKVGNGRHTMRFNIHYGLFRNLTGGLPLAIVGVVLSLVFVNGNLARTIGWIYLGGTCLYAIISIPLLKAMGRHYAQYLFTEYLK